MSSREEVDDLDTSISYVGNWTRGTDDFAADDPDKPWFDGGWHNCRNGDGSGCYAVIDFTGTNITVFADQNKGHGRFFCYLDEYAWTWWQDGGEDREIMPNKSMCSVSGIPAGRHQLFYGAAPSDRVWVDLDWYAVDSEAPEGDSPVWKSDFPTVDPPDDLADTTKVITLSTTSTRQITRTLVDPTTANIPTISASATAEPSSDSGGGGSTTVAVGAGVGAGVGALALLGIIMVMVCYKRRRRSQRGSYHSTPQDSPEAREVGSSPGGSWRATLSFFKGRDTPARDTATTGSLPWSYNAPHMGNEHMGTEDLEDPALFAPRSDRHFSDSASLPISAHTGPTLDSGVSRNATVTSRGRKRLRGPRPV